MQCPSCVFTGNSVVTDYICGHLCESDSEAWQPDDLQFAKSYLRQVPIPISMSVYPSTRANWWSSSPPEDQWLSILEQADGFVFELSPVKLLGSALRQTQFQTWISYARSVGKPSVWLAPKGSSSSYLTDMQVRHRF